MEENFRKGLSDLILNSPAAALGTIHNNYPFVSLVAYSLDKRLCEFYVLLSDLAIHSKNLTSCKNVSLMIQTPKIDSENPLSSSRVTLTGEALKINRHDEKFAELKRNYLAKNTFAEAYFNLGDFNIYAITVEKSRFVAGFAKTFNLTKASLINILGE